MTERVEGRLPLGRSALARELVRLPERTREHLMVAETTAMIVDVVVSLVVILTDDDDPRPAMDRLNGLEQLLEPYSDEDVARSLARLEAFTEADLPLWIKKLGDQSARLYLRRMLGAARYDVLARALRQDAAVLVEALRRGMRFAMPYAAALDSCAAPLSADQRATIAPLPAGSDAVLRMVINLDQALDQLIDSAVLRDFLTLHAPDGESRSVDVAALTANLREMLSGQTSQLLVDLSAGLGRKIQGARDAVDHSADPVSQAANSLIELIDRLLRQAFDEATVLAWIAQNYADQADLTYTAESGKLRPTKKGQALCFAYAGRPVSQRSAFHELAALGLNTTRKKLQELKHADAGDPEELEDLAELFSAVEGYVMFAIKVGWAFADAEDVAALRNRVSPPGRYAGSAA